MIKKINYFDKIFKILFLIFLFTYFGHNYISFNISSFKIYLYQIIILIISSITILHCLKNKNIKIYNFGYLKWNTAFIIISSVSVIWCINTSFSYSALFFLIMNFLLFFSLSIYIDSKEKVFNVFKYYIYAVTYMSIRLILFETGKPGTMYFGNVVGLYFNNIALSLAFAMAILLILFNKFHKKKYLILFILFYYIIYLTGSRKGLLMPLLFTFPYFFLLYKRKFYKKIKLFILMILSLVVGYLFIRSNEQLMFRIIELIESFFGNNVTDFSVNERAYFRETAINLFLQNPILGIGINNFAAHMSAIGYSHVAYSHCNFTEIISNLGIIGFIIYYSLYFILIKNSYIKINSSNRVELNYVLVFMLTLLVFEYGFVSYYIFEAQFQIFMCYLLLKFSFDSSNKSIYH